MIFEWDDFGANHIISDQCQSHDCRQRLHQLKLMNPNFKCTLFAIPDEMTIDLLDWAAANSEWVELAVHGIGHTSNYECEKMTYSEFDEFMTDPLREDIIEQFFVKGFRAPGWQISDGIYEWLSDHDWWVADQNYNSGRRPLGLKTYIYDDAAKTFLVWNGDILVPVEAYHGHVWDVGWNGIYEDAEKVDGLVQSTKEFKFVSEVMK